MDERAVDLGEAAVDGFGSLSLNVKRVGEGRSSAK